MNFYFDNIEIKKFAAAISMFAIIAFMHFAEGNRTYVHYSKPKKVEASAYSWNKKHILFFENIPPMEVQGLIYNQSDAMNYYQDTAHNISLMIGFENVFDADGLPYGEKGMLTSDYIFKELIHATYAGLISAIPSVLSHFILEYLF